MFMLTTNYTMDLPLSLPTYLPTYRSDLIADER